MHARVILGKVKLEKQAEAIKIYHEKVEPAAKGQRGFIRSELLIDPDTNKFISITFWETENDMLAGESSGYLEKQLNKIGPLFVGPPSLQHYIVSE